MKQFFLNILKYFLRYLARLTIWRFKPEIIAITGSVGKTSAKEAIFAVLKNKYSVRKASENFNNELGVPLTILGSWQKVERPLLFFWTKIIIVSMLRLIFSLFSRFNYPRILILEYGAQKPGDIKYLLGIARPKIGIITAIGGIPAHAEFYLDISYVAKEKSKLIEDLYVFNWAVLNHDEKNILEMKNKTRAKVLTFGFDEQADMKITGFENKIENFKPLGVSFKLEHKGSFVPVFLEGVFGRAQAYAGAIGAVVGIIYGLNLVEIADALSLNYKAAQGRMNLTKGIKNSYIIDDSYNASPLSVASALEVLEDFDGLRKIVILGDMLELGKYSAEAHEEIGKIAAGGTDVLITVGPRGKFIAESAINNGLNKSHVLCFDLAEEAAVEIKNILKQGDIVLVKASKAVQLNRVVEAIKEAQ